MQDTIDAGGRARGSSTGGGMRMVLWLVLLAALGLRIGWAVTRPISDHDLEGLPDQLQYLDIARNVVAGNGYWFIDKRVAERVYAFRMPGYPLFLAACRANVRVAQVAQAVIDTSTVLAVYLLAWLISSGTVATVAGDAPPGAPSERRRRAMALLSAAIVAFNPFLIYFCALILSETVCVAMLSWGMVLLLAGYGVGRRRPSTLLWLLGSVILALSILVRPSAILFPILLGIGAAFVNRRGGKSYQENDVARPAARRLRWPLPVGTTMLLLSVLALLPWALRNQRVLHHWIWIDTNGGFTFYDGYNPDATGASNQTFVEYQPQLRSMGEVERSQYLRDRAMDFARTHPRRVAELAIAKFVRTWSPVPLSAEYAQRKYQLVGLFYALPLDLLVLWGLAAGNLSRSAKVFLLLPAIYLSVIHALTVGSLRYRLPAEPALAVLAACALVSGSGYAGTNRERHDVMKSEK